jgi:HSP20 family molecular chaperone IbpA
LPYKWTQTIGDVDLTFSVPGNYKSKDLKVDIQKQKLVAGVKNQEPLINVPFVLCKPLTGIPF